jgi:hypothetical protein
MFIRKSPVAAIAFIALLASACAAWAVVAVLNESKEQLKLQYDVAVRDTGKGSVSVPFTLADEGRLKPIFDIGLYVPAEKVDKDGGWYADLAVSLATRMVDGKKVASFDLRKDWAQRAEIQLMTVTLDGKQPQSKGSMSHVIRVAQYLDNRQTPRNQMP